MDDTNDDAAFLSTLELLIEDRPDGAELGAAMAAFAEATRLSHEATACRVRAKRMREEAMHLLKDAPKPVRPDYTVRGAVRALRVELKNVRAELRALPGGLEDVESSEPVMPELVPTMTYLQMKSVRNAHAEDVVVWLHRELERLRAQLIARRELERVRARALVRR